MRITFLAPLLFLSLYVNAQLDVYSEQGNLVTGVWQVNGMVNDIATESPFLGSNHYKFEYNTTEYWAGFGLNMDNWNTSSNVDFSAYSHISIAYRGLSSGHSLTLVLRTDNESGNQITIGGSSNSYQLVEIPLLSLSAGTGINLASISELNISVTSNDPDASGSVFIDEITLINKAIISGTSQRTWSRFSRLKKGFNFSNWLEAYWLFEFNAYPDETRFNRNIVENLVKLGFNSGRLPVTFEQIAGRTSPYTLDTMSRAFALIDSAITWATEFNFPLIITNHHGYELTDENFSSELPRIRQVWAQVREKYKNLDPERFFFELSNEPTNSISNDNFHAVADSLIKDFRNEGMDHSLIVGGNGYNSASGLLNTRPYEDEDIIYTFHSYDPYFFTHQQMSWTSPAYLPQRPFPSTPSEEQELEDQLDGMKQWSETYNLPVFLGEFGASTGADDLSRCNYAMVMGSAIRKQQIPYFYWDATSPSDAFGFIENGNAIDCFAEALELEAFNVCDLTVVNSLSYGNGTLRSALQCASDGDTIVISDELSGGNIDLRLPSLFIQNNLTIQQNGNAATSINGSGSLTLIEVAPGKTLTLKNVNLNQDETGEQPAIIIKGHVIFQDVNVGKE